MTQHVGKKTSLAAAKPKPKAAVKPATKKPIAKVAKPAPKVPAKPTKTNKPAVKAAASKPSAKPVAKPSKTISGKSNKPVAKPPVAKPVSKTAKPAAKSVKDSMKSASPSKSKTVAPKAPAAKTPVKAVAAKVASKSPSKTPVAAAKNAAAKTPVSKDAAKTESKALDTKSAAKPVAPVKAATGKTAAAKPVLDRVAPAAPISAKAPGKVDVSKPAPPPDDGSPPPKKAGRPPGGTGRRPGRPSKNPNNGDGEFGDAGDGGHEVEDIPDIKPVKRGKRGKGDAKDLIARGPVTPEEYEARRNRLKLLIKLGKDRGYLTYGEINDHLPDDLVDAEAIDGIISTFGDMGIAVYDQAPDAETLLLGENAPVATSDDDVEDEAEAALTTVDSDFGRTTDPVRMYMREMGTVELLTREGEIEIAKRIEGGLKDMVKAISTCPTTINEILNHVQRVREAQAQIDEVVDGLVDDDGAEYAGAGVSDESDEDGPAGGMSSKQLEDLRIKGLAKFEIVAAHFVKMRAAYEKDGYRSKPYMAAQEVIQNELMGIRFTAKMVERLADTLRQQVEEVRKIERAVLHTCVDRAGMPRTHFIKSSLVMKPI